MNKNKLLAQLSKHSLQAQLDDFEKYINQTPPRQAVDLLNLQKAYEDEKKDAQSDYIEYLDDYYSEQYNFLIEIQPNIFNKSTLVSLYSSLEHNLNDFCNLCQKMKGTNISVADFNGDGIHKAKKYLTKLMGIDFGQSQEWQFITEFNKVRNCIVHANGDINKMTSTDKLQTIVNNEPELSLKKDNITISAAYLIKSIREINGLFLWLYECIDGTSS
ncbi:hypothetical protein LU196_09650 [Pantoea sp. Mb-10]|uniref:hypothetical protein n=1 Tax=unclassified Pantoea TaxID=2630326 RepID=UPI001E4C55A2|nr:MULTISPECIES: hypothetical protein [unclassified Pantoea]MCE0490312.1 hypothetical protein [Pantoea sp. Mb-10]MCE0501443.1 hypothetical protein [Pantoea sp. Pb-8]